MNLHQTIDVFAGGPGSGCNPDKGHCGRPVGSKHEIEEGDQVKLKVPVVLYNMKTGNNDKNVMNQPARVEKILPKIGSNEQMIKVNVIPTYKHHEKDLHQFVKVSDVKLDKLGSVAQVTEVKPVPKSKVITKFKTADGADVTWVRPHVDHEEDVKSLKEIAESKHYMSGKFAQIDVVKGIQDKPGYKRVTRMYDTSNYPAPYQKGSGASVWVDAYTRKGKITNVRIAEQNYTTYGTKTRGVLTFNYKNAAAGVGMLKSRYGITTKLSRLRG